MMTPRPSHESLQEMLEKRERLVEQLRRSEEAGDDQAAALLEYGIAECDGVIALITDTIDRQ
jgi:hypothetical protein